ncbi:TonB-dependent receptor [Campylobacter gracilis]|uniref:TonB-dependent siderophore receptor n=1 Tax=Campylobacter gracilis RM3268 TaxID=553220 RepID=C8PIS9_9BACT|nr:TonB-dependent receptor [Campylobacter gracilis]EEV16834.1 TonB-dependent siderophore receptor [Campylobacter gracilis RM3268]UEB46625.1 TonB-dependent receptor [Campylobacter gracilis]SUW81968.1 TonB-dependent receptor domain-containing protein [Campylobacter gracilis]
MKFKISLAACMCLLCSSLAAAQSGGNSAPEKSQNMGVIEVNSVGDNISESGIDEGFLSKNVQQGMLAGKRALDLPYQINTISKEIMNHQGVTGYEEAVKYFPSAQIQMRGGATVGRPQTRGFEGSVVGNSFWDGFYTISTTAIPMAMFESFQVQNGVAGSLYGAQNPVGIFSYTRKRPVKDQYIIWSDYMSRSNLGLGLDLSDKFEKFGYRTVFYGSNGDRQPKGSNLQRRLASVTMEFYPTGDLTFETAASYYEHNTKGFAGQFALGVRDGKIVDGMELPKAVDSSKRGLGQSFGGMHLKTTTASAKFKFTPTDKWYLEGGFQFQRADRDTHGVVNYILPSTHPQYTKPGDYKTRHSGGATAAYRFDLPSGYLKANTQFNTGDIEHDFSVQTNGYHWTQDRYKNASTNYTSPTIGNIYDPKILNYTGARRGSGLYHYAVLDMYNVSVLDDITINDKFDVMLSASKAWMRQESYNARQQRLVKAYSDSGYSWASSLIFHPIEDASIYYTYADSLQQGSTYVYNSGPHNGEVSSTSPYRSKQHEIGAKIRVADMIDFSVAYFDIRRPIAYLNSSTGIYGINGEQRNRGFEFMSGGRITQNLSVLGGFTYIDPKMHNVSIAGANRKVANGIPKLNANLMLDYVIPGTDKLAISTNFHYTSKMYLDDLNTQHTPSFFVTDLGIRYTSERLLGDKTTLRFNVNNVFNKKYWAGMYPASADGAGGLNVTSVLGSANGVTLGESRSFMLSAEIKF